MKLDFSAVLPGALPVRLPLPFPPFPQNDANHLLFDGFLITGLGIIAVIFRFRDRGQNGFPLTFQHFHAMSSEIIITFELWDSAGVKWA